MDASILIDDLSHVFLIITDYIFEGEIIDFSCILHSIISELVEKQYKLLKQVITRIKISGYPNVLNIQLPQLSDFLQ